MVRFMAASAVVVLREEADSDGLLARVPPSDLYASGRFSGYVDLGEGRPGEQLGDAPLEDALVWARRRAEVVLLRLFDSDYYSAGSRNPEPDVLPDWDDDTVVRRRRPRGLEMLDNRLGRSGSAGFRSSEYVGAGRRSGDRVVRGRPPPFWHGPFVGWVVGDGRRQRLSARARCRSAIRLTDRTLLPG
jgi:hypothetical protein